jgi:hypothetical protein
MKQLFCLVIILTSVLSVQSQEEWSELYRIEGETNIVAFDNLLNVYRVKNSELIKYDQKGKFLFRFSDKQLGDIGSIDVTFPLRPLVLYPELNYLILLDNTLSNNRGNINLLHHNIGLATAAALSVQNHFWVYDAMQFSLIRLNENFNEVSNTGNLAQILGIELSPTFMVEFANKLYMNDPEVGILIFDIFGTYIKTIPLKGLRSFQVFENELIVYLTDSELVTYDTRLFTSSQMKLPTEALDGYLQKNKLALLTREGIIVYEKSKL